jgi:hypothetical protein
MRPPRRVRAPLAEGRDPREDRLKRFQQFGWGIGISSLVGEPLALVLQGSRVG